MGSWGLMRMGASQLKRSRGSREFPDHVFQALQLGNIDESAIVVKCVIGAGDDDLVGQHERIETDCQCLA